MQYKEYLLCGIKATFMQSVDGEVDADSMKQAIKELFMPDLTDLRNKNYRKAIHGIASKSEDIKPDIKFLCGLRKINLDMQFLLDLKVVDKTIKDCLTFTNDDVKLLDKFRHDNAEILEMEKEYSELFNNLPKHFEGDAGRFINEMMQLFDKMTEKLSHSEMLHDYKRYFKPLDLQLNVYNMKLRYDNLLRHCLNLELKPDDKAVLMDFKDTMGKLIDKSYKIMTLQLRIVEEEEKLVGKYNAALTKIINECHQEITQEFQIKVLHEVQAIKQAEKLKNNIKNLLQSSIIKLMQDAEDKNRTEKMQEICDTKIQSIFDSTIKDGIISWMLNDDENHTDENHTEDLRNKIKNALKLELGGDGHASDIFLDDFMKSSEMKQALKTFYTITVLPAVLEQANQNVNVTENAVNQYNETQNGLYNLFCKFYKFIFRIFGFLTLDDDLTQLNAEHNNAKTFRDKIKNQTQDQYIQKHFKI
jgi:hypothetical protein